MTHRHLPICPRRDQLESEAEDLHRRYLQADAEARREFTEFASDRSEEVMPTIHDSQQVLAKAYGAASWQRLMLACEIVDGIRSDDTAKVSRLVTEHPSLLHEDARGAESNWGPPMSYAANLGRLKLVQTLHALGAKDLHHAFARACLQGQTETARWLHSQGAAIERGVIMGCCETLNADGLELLLDLGAELCDEQGDTLAPLALILETYSRSPDGKHRCLELLSGNGYKLPDTPVMAFHRGRIDLLERFLQSDSTLPSWRFRYRDIYPLECGCHEDESLGLHGTPLDGTTLLHLCVDFDENEMAHWLVENGADVNAKATVDAKGFGGHTPLHNAAVSQAITCGRQTNAAMAKWLLDQGADPNIRASIRKELRFVEDESEHRYENVTPAEYARAFHNQRWVSHAVIDVLESAVS